LKTKYLNHPLMCLGYRFEYQGKSACLAFDTEPFQNLFCSNPQDPTYDETIATEGELAAMEGNQAILNFYSGADILIHDAQYTQDEYDSCKKGWGHSPIEGTIKAVKHTDVKQLVLFHHEPLRTDQQLDQLTKKYCRSNGKNSTKVIFAREGMQLSV